MLVTIEFACFAWCPLCANNNVNQCLSRGLVVNNQPYNDTVAELKALAQHLLYFYYSTRM